MRFFGVQRLLLLAVIAAFGCRHERSVVGDSPVRTPVGSWEGVVSATNADVVNATGQTLNVSVVIAQNGDRWSGQCSQSGSKVPTIRNARIESFKYNGVDPAGGIVLLEGKCGGRTFTLAYHPICDQIFPAWLDLKYIGSGLECAPNSGLNRTKENARAPAVPSSPPPPSPVERIAEHCPEFRGQLGLVTVASCSLTEFGEFASFRGDTYYYALYCVEEKGSDARYNGSCHDPDSFNSSYGMSRSNIAIFVRHGADDSVRAVLSEYDTGGPNRTPRIVENSEGAVMELPLSIAASCDCNASSYYLWRPQTREWALMDWESWQHEAELKFPPDLTNQNGYWPDLSTLTTSGALWRPDDAHCCPSGGSVSVQLGIVDNRFVLRSLEIKVNRVEQSR